MDFPSVLPRRTGMSPIRAPNSGAAIILPAGGIMNCGLEVGARDTILCTDHSKPPALVDGLIAAEQGVTRIARWDFLPGWPCLGANPGPHWPIPGRAGDPS